MLTLGVQRVWPFRLEQRLHSLGPLACHSIREVLLSLFPNEGTFGSLSPKDFGPHLVYVGEQVKHWLKSLQLRRSQRFVSVRAALVFEALLLHPSVVLLLSQLYIPGAPRILEPAN